MQVCKYLFKMLILYKCNNCKLFVNLKTLNLYLYSKVVKDIKTVSTLYSKVVKDIENVSTKAL